MKYTPGILREVLHSLIRKLGETPEQFVRRPGRDFTRPRTLRFETVISLLLTMSENSVGKALIKRFKSMENTPSASALVQQREKLLPAALETLFQRFTACLRPTGHFQGYRLLAADGSDLKSAAYPGDPASYRPGTARQHGCRVNFSDAVFACCLFLREAISDPLPLLQRKLFPVRPGRTSPRPKITGNRISSCYASAR